MPDVERPTEVGPLPRLGLDDGYQDGQDKDAHDNNLHRLGELAHRTSRRERYDLAAKLGLCRLP